MLYSKKILRHNAITINLSFLIISFDELKSFSSKCSYKSMKYFIVGIIFLLFVFSKKFSDDK